MLPGWLNTIGLVAAPLYLTVIPANADMCAKRTERPQGGPSGERSE